MSSGVAARPITASEVRVPPEAARRAGEVQRLIAQEDLQGLVSLLARLPQRDRLELVDAYGRAKLSADVSAHFSGRQRGWVNFYLESKNTAERMPQIDHYLGKGTVSYLDMEIARIEGTLAAHQDQGFVGKLMGLRPGETSEAALAQRLDAAKKAREAYKSALTGGDPGRIEALRGQAIAQLAELQSYNSLLTYGLQESTDLALERLAKAQTVATKVAVTAATIAGGPLAGTATSSVISAGAQLVENGRIDGDRFVRDTRDGAALSVTVAVTNLAGPLASGATRLIGATRVGAILSGTGAVARVAQIGARVGTTAVAQAGTAAVGTAAAAELRDLTGDHEGAERERAQISMAALRAGAAGVILGPLAGRFSGLAGRGADGALGAAEQYAWNKLEGRAASEGVAESALNWMVFGSHVERGPVGTPVRIKVETFRNGEPVFSESHGYRLVHADPRRGVAEVVAPSGARETHPLDRVVHEASGMALGALSPVQYARSQSRLMGLEPAELIQYAKHRARAADISPEHASYVERMFAQGVSLPRIEAEVAAISVIPRAELAARTYGASEPQQFTTSCVPAAVRELIAGGNPHIAREIGERPELAARWDRGVLQRSGGVAEQRTDADFGPQERNRDPLWAPTMAEPLVSTGEHQVFDARDLAPRPTVELLNQRAFWKNRELIVTLSTLPQEVLRLRGDARGRVSVESLSSTPTTRRATGRLFGIAEDGSKPVVAIEDGGTLVPIRALRAPKEVELPARGRGMDLIRDLKLMETLEASSGARYLARDPRAFSGEQLMEAIDWSLDQGHPVVLAVHWHDVAGRPRDSRHALVLQPPLRRLSDHNEYLLVEPHDGSRRWVRAEEIQAYRRFEGRVGLPTQVLLPDFIPLPGGATMAGGGRIAGGTEGVPARREPGARQE